MTKIMIMMILIFFLDQARNRRKLWLSDTAADPGSAYKTHLTLFSSLFWSQRSWDTRQWPLTVFPARSGERQRPWEDGEDREDVGGARKRVGPSEKCFSSEEDPKVCSTRRSWYSLLVSLLPISLSLSLAKKIIYIYQSEKSSIQSIILLEKLLFRQSPRISLHWETSNDKLLKGGQKPKYDHHDFGFPRDIC